MTNAYRLPDWELLLKAVVASSDDDLPRLVAADWLDEHDEPERAEFIRVQIERAKSDRPELEWREKALWNNPLFGPSWATEACPAVATLDFGSSLRTVAVSGSERVTFRRGFPFRVSCTAGEWLRHGKGIVPRQPVRELVLTRCGELESARWWLMANTLRSLVRVEIDSPSLPFATFLRNYICPGVQVCNADGPVEDEIISDSWEMGGREVHPESRMSREVTPPPRNDIPN